MHVSILLLMIKLFSQKEAFETENGLVTPNNKNLYWAFGLVAGSWLICLLISGVIWLTNPAKDNKGQAAAVPELTPFASETEFRNYFASAEQTYSSTVKMGMTNDMALETAPAELPMAGGATAERYSETNVQVAGIDEPDIVKTDGKHLFVSSEQRLYFDGPMMMPDARVDLGRPIDIAQAATTDIIKVLPVNEANKLSEVAANGNLLVTEDRLLVFETRKLTGFNISDPAKPKETWAYELDGNQVIETARLIDGTLALVTRTSVYQQSPCPIPLWRTTTSETTIACTDIWRPEGMMSADGVYTVVLLNPKDGTVDKTMSFVGSQNQTVVYVSPTFIYITFTNSKSWEEITTAVLLDPTTTLVNEETKTRLAKVFDLDISQAAKRVEMEQIIAGYTNSLNDDERMKWQAELTNRIDDYAAAHKRELEQTIITKIEVKQLNIAASGQVPGRPLNQFSLDEYQSNLRIAVTVGGRGGVGVESANDVYVLDGKLATIGSVTDLGKEERIYAVRFMADRGFVVTFKETDPLYTLDLSNPQQPQVTGELKIPGYSSYLHPLKEHLLVGVGKEDNQVKVSLFDVSEAASPQEMDKYQLPDYWSDILSTHLAFLQDEKHEIFFVPASSGGYIFSYADDTLTLKKTISGGGIRRAVYINDYLYLVGNQQITIISEQDWQTIKTMEW